MEPQPDEPPRPPDLDVPPAHLGAALELLGDIDRIRAGSDEMMRGVEEATGLRLGEVQVLEAVAGGADHVRAVARRTGQPAEATRATVDGLLGQDLLGRHHHPAADTATEPAMLHVTDRGHAVLAQVDAIRLRVTDALLTALGRGEAEHLHETVHAFSAALSVGAPVQDALEGGDGRLLSEVRWQLATVGDDHAEATAS